jgi:predicted 2-oxoglutarate/Fe(II)-dependent dioxygenase YbiX
LSSINLHYANEGQELGWHFDNSSFAITLLVQSPKGGGEFEYVTNLRNASQGDMNYDGVNQVLAGKVNSKKLAVSAGDLVLFRGRDALHRVTPTQGDRTRMLVVLAYNSEPNVALSESARTTFYGRLG